MEKRFVKLNDVKIKDNKTGDEFSAESKLLKLLNDLNDENLKLKKDKKHLQNMISDIYLKINDVAMSIRLGKW